MKVIELYDAMHEAGYSFDEDPITLAIIKERQIIANPKMGFVFDDQKNKYYCETALMYDAGFPSEDWDDRRMIITFCQYDDGEIPDFQISSHRFPFSSQNSPLLCEVAKVVAREQGVTFRPYGPPIINPYLLVEHPKDQNYSHFCRCFNEIANFIETKKTVERATNYMERILSNECRRLYDLGAKK